MSLQPNDLRKEFDRQVENFLNKGYPTLADISEARFLEIIAPLKKRLEQVDLTELDLENGKLPFVIVVKNELVPTQKAVSLAIWNGKPGITKLNPLLPSDFTNIDTVDTPKSSVYLLLDVDRGKENINLPPREAMKKINQKGRSPLTIDEGVTLVTQFPEFLIKNNCFSLLASRHAGDQRVPAIWINANKQPNLGWCWNGNPHTWLGSASCQSRVS